MNSMKMKQSILKLKALLIAALPPLRLGLSFPNAFSLPEYQRARARRTADCLDASRFHFSILFVDDDNSRARVAEGVFARVAEYNDAMFVLFPASATVASSPNAPIDAAAPNAAVATCDALGLCPERCSATGTSFALDCLDDYDLIVSMSEEVQSKIIQSLGRDRESYAPMCRSISEFLSRDFCNIHKREAEGDGDRPFNPLDMLEEDLLDIAAPYERLLRKASSDLRSPPSTVREDVCDPLARSSEDGIAAPDAGGGRSRSEAAIVLASAGLCSFCLDTIDRQMEAAFDDMLRSHFRRADLGCNFDEADERLRRGSSPVSGYFSAEQRRERFERHMERLRSEFPEG